MNVTDVMLRERSQSKREHGTLYPSIFIKFKQGKMNVVLEVRLEVTFVGGAEDRKDEQEVSLRHWQGFKS